MPYRDDDDVLLERLNELNRARDEVSRRERELSGLAAERTRIDRELDAVRKRFSAKGRKSLPLLDQIKVATPCNVPWDSMQGDDVTRFCGHCSKNVHNLSAMPREQAESFLESRVGEDICVRFYRRPDGTVMSGDCPVGVRRKQRRQAVLAVAGAGMFAATAASMLTVQGKPCTTETMGEVAVQGGIEAQDPEPIAPTMGTVAPPPPDPPTDEKNASTKKVDTKPVHHVRMGRLKQPSTQTRHGATETTQKKPSPR